MWKDYSGKGSSYIISFLRDLTVKLDNIEIYRETQGSISRSELRIKNFSGGYSIGSVLRIDFKPGVRASFEEVFINYKNVLCWNKKISWIWKNLLSWIFTWYSNTCSIASNML